MLKKISAPRFLRLTNGTPQPLSFDAEMSGVLVFYVAARCVGNAT
jgi:hypothetical protein